MADTYAVVQKRGALAVTRSGSGARGAEEAPLYSQVTPRAQRPQAPAEDVRGTLPGRGESGRPRERAGRAGARLVLAPPPAGPPPRGPAAGRPRKCSGPHLRPGVWAGIRDLAAPPGARPARWAGPRAPASPALEVASALGWCRAPPAAGADAWAAVSCLQFLLIPALLGLAPTKTWPMGLRPEG